MAHRTTKTTRLLTLSLLALLSVHATPVSGQDFGFEANRFHPTPSQRMGYFTLDSGQSLPGGGWELGLMGWFADDPLVANRQDERLFAVIDHQVGLHLLAAWAPINNLQFGLDVPFYLVQGAGDANFGAGESVIESAGIGDIRVTPKWTFFHGRSGGTSGFDAALLIPISIPIGDADAFQGEDFRLEPRLAADYATQSGWAVGLNAGFLVRPTSQEFSNVEIGNQLTYGVGLKVPIVSTTLLGVAEINGAVAIGAEDSGTEEAPLELLGGGRANFGGFYLTFGAGTGLIEGFGAPDWRVFLGLAYSHGDEVTDRDGDGYLDHEDGCPDDPEDFDSFRDEDGCPDPDNDQDGILDVDDQCPLDPEDHDGFEDEDGCPDPDNDQDGILDDDDRCPDDPEDLDGFEDADGCPDPDNDQDGILDVDDQCPNVAEDFDRYEDEDGCPEEGPAIVRPTTIEITQQIQFDYDSARIRAASDPIVEAVARILIDNPDIQRVRVEGHTSTEGETDHNLDLSNRRARSVVDALVEQGVSRDRLRSQGFGESQPLQPDEDDPAARELNRRVEFHIEERSE